MSRNRARLNEQFSSIMSSRAKRQIADVVASTAMGAAIATAGLGVWQLHDHIEASQEASRARQQTIATLQKQAQAESQAAHKPMLVSPDVANEPTPNPAQLFQPNQLPGYGMKVTASSEQALERSTVAVLARPKAAGTWTLRCNGIKIDFNGEPFVLWSDECDATGADGAGFNSSGQPQTKNVLAQSNDVFAVAQTAPGGSATTTPIALVTGEAIENYGSASLMSVASTPAFAAIPAVPMNELAAVLPVVGQQVATDTYASNGQRTAATGTYLGDLGNSFIVGFSRNEDPGNKMCSQAEQGSGIVLSDGSVSGSLLTQYDDKNPNTWAGTISDYPYLEQQIGVDPDSFGQICAYDQPNLNTLLGLADTLGMNGLKP